MVLRNCTFFLAVVIALNCKAQGLYLYGGDLFNIPYGHLIPTVLFSAGNGIFITRNIIKIRGVDKQKSNAGFGLITGTGQMMYGLLYHDEEKNYTSSIAAIDVAVGLTTVITSAVRLFKKSPAQEPAVTVNLISFSNYKQNTITCGIRVRARF